MQYQSALGAIHAWHNGFERDTAENLTGTMPMPGKIFIDTNIARSILHQSTACRRVATVPCMLESKFAFSYTEIDESA